MRFDELRKKFLGRGLLAALFIVAAAAALYGGGVLLKADADPTGVPESVAKDPLDILKNARLVPKQRLLVTRETNMGDMENIVFTDKDNDDMEYNGEYDYSFSSKTALPSFSVFASAAAEGFIPREVTLSPDLCGDTSVTVRKNLHVGSYLSHHDDGTNELCLSLRDDDKYGLYYIDEIIIPGVVPDYECGGMQLDRNRAHDLAAFDWNGDGYADYLVTFCTTAADGEAYARLLLVDGKSLYEKATVPWEAGEVKYYYVNGGGTALGVNSGSFRGALSYRMTIGDFDEDGKAEAAVYFSRSTGDPNDGNRLEIYRIGAGDGGGFTSSQIYAEDTGSSSESYYSGGLAAGDLNGDGHDELVLLKPLSDGSVAMSVYQWKAGDFAKTADSAPTGVYLSSLSGVTASPLNAAIADIDGDGFGELMWTLGVKRSGENQLILYIHDWNSPKGADITGLGSKYEYNLHDFKEMGWTLNPDYIRHSLCTGYFIYDPQSRRAQIAVGCTGPYSHSTVNKNYSAHYVGVFSWSSGDGLKLNGKGKYDTASTYGIGSIVQAVDFYEESLVVGAPTVITVEDNIELYMVTQAPPKHWDRVRAAGSALSGYAEEDGKVTLDSFAVFDTDGYYTGMQLNGEWGSSSSETGTHGLKTGASLGFELSHKGSVVDEIFHRSENIANEDPMLDIGGQYGADRVKENTDEYATAMNYTFSYRADRDDQLYYRANDYSVCRYPIILPADKRFITVSDDAGVEYKAQNYFQFIVPTETASTFTPTPGRSISWYEPLHDNYNLFTYPKRLTDITGYPQGKEAKISINPYNPLSDINGEVFISGTGNVIGNLDASEFHMDASTSSKHSDMKHVSQTGGAHAYIHPTIGGKLTREFTLKIDLNGDYTWGTDSTTTTDASAMFGVTMAWPGARNYTMYTDNWSAADMQFKSDIAYFTHDDGAFCVGYAVPELESFQSRIWGPGSPYMTYADPGLLLPFRWNNDIKNKSAGHNIESMVYYLAENDNPNTSCQMRGLSFEKQEDASQAPTGDNHGTATKLLECGQKYNLRLRVINYSFVNTREVKVKFYYQPWTEGGANYPAANPATDGGCEEITGDNPAVIKSISGRTEKSYSGDNWDYAVLNGWTAPKDTGLGWIHAVISYDGEQLSTDNDHGYIMVGSYDPQDFFGTVSAQAANVARAASVSVESYPDIAITGVTAYEMAKDGTVSQEPLTIDEKSRSKKMKIDVSVKYTGGRLNIGGEEKEINYLPLLRVGLLAGKRGVNRSLLGATEFPLIRAGE
ncbi:FG-GAP repeat domain-containing protein, partial [Cloacibacillus porcorum]